MSVTTVRASTADSGAVVDIRSRNTVPDAPDAGFTSTEFEEADSVGSNNVVELTDTAPGTTYILIKVTAANAVATKTYTVTVTRAALNASDNASVTNLQLDTGDADSEGLNTAGNIADDGADNLYLDMPFLSSRLMYATTATRNTPHVT